MALTKREKEALLAVAKKGKAMYNNDQLEKSKAYLNEILVPNRNKSESKKDFEARKEQAALYMQAEGGIFSQYTNLDPILQHKLVSETQLHLDGDPKEVAKGIHNSGQTLNPVYRKHISLLGKTNPTAKAVDKHLSSLMWDDTLVTPTDDQLFTLRTTFGKAEVEQMLKKNREERLFLAKNFALMHAGDFRQTDQKSTFFLDATSP